MAEAEAEAEAEAQEEEEEEEVDEEEEVEVGNESDGDPPDYSDVDASAARQLHEEATARSRAHAAKKADRRRKQPTPPPVYEEEKEFTSFFAKPYQRAAALGKNRRSGRSVAAWGHPVPEPPERDFDLPEEYRDEETLKSMTLDLQTSASVPARAEDRSEENSPVSRAMPPNMRLLPGLHGNGFRHLNQPSKDESELSRFPRAAHYQEN